MSRWRWSTGTTLKKMGLPAPVEFQVLKGSAMICILIAVVVASAMAIFWKCGVNPIIDFVSILHREKKDLKNEKKRKKKQENKANRHH